MTTIMLEGDYSSCSMSVVNRIYFSFKRMLMTLSFFSMFPLLL